MLKHGEYRVEETLGQGGFGITYRGVQVGLGRTVAIKEFYMKEHCDRNSATLQVSVPSTGSRELVERFKQKFLKEARLMASFENRHIVRVTDVFEANGTAYYVMDYLGSRNLASLVAECGALSEERALSYIRQVCDALSEVHARNLLHLDIKPGNIMLNSKGEAVLIDFGISKHYDESGSQTSSAVVGISEGFAPIEQYEAGALQNFTPATDVYAVGATLYFMLANARPPKASYVMNEGLPALPAGISSATRNAVERAMEPRRKLRPQSVNEFLRLLKGTESNANSSKVVGVKPVAMVSGGGKNGVVASVSYNVVLKSAGAGKLAVVKAVCVSCGLGLKEAKGLVDAVPSVLRKGIPGPEAESLKKALEEVGAEVELKPLGGNSSINTNRATTVLSSLSSKTSAVTNISVVPAKSPSMGNGNEVKKVAVPVQANKDVTVVKKPSRRTSRVPVKEGKPLWEKILIVLFCLVMISGALNTFWPNFWQLLRRWLT